MQQNGLIVLYCPIQYIFIVYFDFRKETLGENAPNYMFANVLTEIFAAGGQLHISKSNLITLLYQNSLWTFTDQRDVHRSF